MPQIIIKGMPVEKVEKISGELSKSLGEIMETPEDWFSIEHLPTTFFVSGERAFHYPMVQVNWFNRGQEMQDKSAKAIDKIIRNQGYEQIEIWFIPLEKEMYYENGGKF